MKLNISVALEEGDSTDYSITLLDGTELHPENGNVHVDAAPFLKQPSRQQNNWDQGYGE